MNSRSYRRKSSRWPLALWFSSPEEFWRAVEFTAWIVAALLLAFGGFCLDHSALH